MLSQCLPACSPAHSLVSQEAGFSLWGVCAAITCTGPWGPPPHPGSPAVPGSEQTPREERSPASVARFSWCPVHVSPPPHSPGLRRRGQQPQEGQTHADHTGAVEVSTPLVHVCALPPPCSLILSDAHGSSQNEVPPPQTFLLVSMKSLLHLLGLRLFRGAGTVYPRDTPFYCFPGRS